jgi:hypothetical protein
MVQLPLSMLVPAYVVCTYTNARDTGTIIVHKIIDPDGIIDGEGATDDQFPGDLGNGRRRFGDDTSDFAPQFTGADGTTTLAQPNRQLQCARAYQSRWVRISEYYCDNVADDNIVFMSRRR